MGQTRLTHIAVPTAGVVDVGTVARDGGVGRGNEGQEEGGQSQAQHLRKSQLIGPITLQLITGIATLVIAQQRENTL